MKKTSYAAIVVTCILTALTGCQKVTPLPAQTAVGTTKKTAGLNIYFEWEWVKAAYLPWRSRVGAVGFAIGSKGYVGGGEFDDAYWGEQVLQDFWEYDPSTNEWYQKANIPIPVTDAATFVIGTQAYVCTGENVGGMLSTVYRYDQASDTWTRVADFPGGARYGAVGFSIGNEGYVGTGFVNQAGGFRGDFWRYDPPSNQWSQIASLWPGYERVSASSFSVGGYGFVTCGEGNTGLFGDMWEYLPNSNTWIPQPGPTKLPRYGAIGFNDGSYGALTCGLTLEYPTSETYVATNDFWYYNPSTNVWTQDINFAGGARFGGVGFNLGGTPYVGTGLLYVAGQQDWQEQTNDLWYETFVIF